MDTTSLTYVTIPIFVVSLSSADRRRQRMIDRLTRQELSFELIDACSEKDITHLVPSAATPFERRVAACFASHLKALHTFTAGTDSEAIVLEDDVRLAHRFAYRLDSLRGNIHEDCPIVSLGYLFWHEEGFRRTSPRPRGGLRTMGWDLWGTQGYLIRRRWAEHCLEAFDQPLATISTKDVRTAELITRSARDHGGLVAWPPLVIEDLTESIIDPEGRSNHREGQARWSSTDYED